MILTNVSFPRAVIFDWDNTLVDAWGCVTDALNMARQAFSQPPISIQETKGFSAKSAKNLFKDWYGEEADKAHDIFYGRYQESHLAHLKAIEGADNLLIYLKELRVPLFVVSNKRGDILRQECHCLGWDSYFLSLVGSLDADRDKPEREPVDMALQQAGLKADDSSIWFVGDTHGDVQCARNAGCTPVLLHNHQEAEKLGVSLSFSSCQGLIDFLISLEPSQTTSSHVNAAASYK